MTVRELLKNPSKISPSDREWLLCSLFSCTRAELFLKNEKISAAQIRKFRLWLKKREKGVPLQYITSLAPFYGREFIVDKNVLIPRTETEVLVELLLREGDALGGAVRVLDIGVGSGAIALTTKLERPHWSVDASDVSAAALHVAKRNAKRLGVSMAMKKSHLLSAVRGDYDIIVSNPPYLNNEKDKVAGDVMKHEPKLALFPQKKEKTSVSDQGAWLADKIIAQSLERKARPKKILLELSPRVASVLEKKWKKSSLVEKIWREADLAGRKRFLLLALR